MTFYDFWTVIDLGNKYLVYKKITHWLKTNKQKKKLIQSQNVSYITDVSHFMYVASGGVSDTH